MQAFLYGWIFLLSSGNLGSISLQNNTHFYQNKSMILNNDHFLIHIFAKNTIFHLKTKQALYLCYSQSILQEPILGWREAGLPSGARQEGRNCNFELLAPTGALYVTMHHFKSAPTHFEFSLRPILGRREAGAILCKGGQSRRKIVI